MDQVLLSPRIFSDKWNDFPAAVENKSEWVPVFLEEIENLFDKHPQDHI